MPWDGGFSVRNGCALEYTSAGTLTNMSRLSSATEDLGMIRHRNFHEGGASCDGHSLQMHRSEFTHIYVFPMVVPGGHNGVFLP